MAARFPGAALLVQAMVTGGVELIVGAQRTRATGPVIMLGIGGIFAEVLDDVVFAGRPLRPRRSVPRSAACAQRLLDGYRGMPAVNRDAVATIAARLFGGRRGEPVDRRGRSQPGHSPTPTARSSSTP